MFFIKLFGLFVLIIVTISFGITSCTFNDPKSRIIKYVVIGYFIGILTVLLAYGKVIIDSAGIR